MGSRKWGLSLGALAVALWSAMVAGMVAGAVREYPWGLVNDLAVACSVLWYVRFRYMRRIESYGQTLFRLGVASVQAAEQKAMADKPPRKLVEAMRQPVGAESTIEVTIGGVTSPVGIAGQGKPDPESEAGVWAYLRSTLQETNP